MEETDDMAHFLTHTSPKCIPEILALSFIADELSNVLIYVHSLQRLRFCLDSPGPRMMLRCESKSAFVVDLSAQTLHNAF